MSGVAFRASPHVSPHDAIKSISCGCFAGSYVSLGSLQGNAMTQHDVSVDIRLSPNE